jgi:hypothetical protein
MRPLASVASIVVALVLLAIGYLYAAGRYGMSDARYRCEGQLLPLGGGTTQTVELRIQLYRWWMHWLKRGGVVFLEHPSFREYPATYLRMYTKVEESRSHIVFWTGMEGAREGRLSLDDMTLTVATHDGTHFSGVCARVPPPDASMERTRPSAQGSSVFTIDMETVRQLSAETTARVTYEEARGTVFVTVIDKHGDGHVHRLVLGDATRTQALELLGRKQAELAQRK